MISAGESVMGPIRSQVDHRSTQAVPVSAAHRPRIDATRSPPQIGPELFAGYVEKSDQGRARSCGEVGKRAREDGYSLQLRGT